MSRRVIAVVALVVVGVVVPVAAGRAGKHKLRVDSTVAAARVGQQGAATILAGRVTDPRLGEGATVYRVKGTVTQTATFTEWSDKGLFRGVGTVRATPTAGGLSFSGSGKVTGGGGAYRGANGRLTITGMVGADGIFHLHVTGTISY